jgi:uncharacterized repeat protein (TIGR02543 family)
MANVLYAVLRNQSPVGSSFNFGPVQGSLINTPATQNIEFNELVRTQLQERIWRIVQQWNAGIEVESLFSPTNSQNYHALNVENGGGSGIYRTWTTVNISANHPEPGYVFLTWSGDTQFVDDITSVDTSVTLPNDTLDLTVTAIFTPIDVVDNRYRYYRLEINNIGGSGALHISEIQWLDGGDTAITPLFSSNQSGNVVITTNYPFAANAYRAYDTNLSSDFYINSGTQSLPINITVDFAELIAAPAQFRILLPTWGENLNSFRVLGSNDLLNWVVFHEANNVGQEFVNDGVNRVLTLGLFVN